jgi:hypothetical protein
MVWGKVMGRLSDVRRAIGTHEAVVKEGRVTRERFCRALAADLLLGRHL